MRSVRATVSVNGEEYTREIEPRLLLVHFLRDELGLTGTHWGCDTSNCGACVVQIDGEPVKSCTTLAVMCEGFERDGFVADRECHAVADRESGILYVPCRAVQDRSSWRRWKKQCFPAD